MKHFQPNTYRVIRHELPDTTTQYQVVFFNENAAMREIDGRSVYGTKQSAYRRCRTLQAALTQSTLTPTTQAETEMYNFETEFKDLNMAAKTLERSIVRTYPTFNEYQHGKLVVQDQFRNHNFTPEEEVQFKKLCTRVRTYNERSFIR